MSIIYNVSIITITFNCKNELIKTIESIREQDYRNYEFIVVDGDSSDGTKEILEVYKNSIHISISEPDDGIYHAMNKGLSLARGNWVIFMNSGDVFESSKTLSNVFKQRFDSFDILYGDVRRQYKKQSIVVKAQPFFNLKGVREMGICHQSIFIRREIILNSGFDTKFEIVADYKMVYELIQLGYKIKYLDLVVSKIDPYGISQKKPLAVGLEIVSFFKGKWYQKFMFVLKSLIKYHLSKLIFF